MKLTKLISAVMILVLAVSLSACGGGSAETTDSSGNSGETTNSAGNSGASNTENEELYTVAIQVVTLPGVQSEGIEDREAAINAIIEPAINCNIDIQEVWISELNQTTSMAAAGGEKLDILHVGTVSRLSSMVGTEILADMSGLVTEYGQELVTLFGEDLLEAGTVDGQLLAIPAKLYNANAKGIYYNKTMADDLGITVPEKITSLEDLEGILEQVHAANPDVYPFYTGDGTQDYLSWLSGYSSFGNLASYGAILDENSSLTVENLFATEMYKEFALTMYEWKEKGLQPGDATDSSPAQDYFSSGNLFCVVSNINESLKSDMAANSPDFELGWIEMVAPKITNASVTEYMWGIASTSERPEKAMAFLEMLYTNAEVANILMYGLPEVNYSLVEGSEKVVVRNGSYLPMFYRGGDPREMYIQAPNGEDFIEKTEAFAATATVSPILGYVFSDADYQTESSVINSTINEFLPRIMTGSAGSEAATLELLEAFNEKLAASGINDVIEANQEQLDAYISAN